MRPQLVDYRRLPGRTLLTPGKTQALYAGPDHLLLLSTSMFAESYKRFYYGDIQAITVRKTSTGAVWNAVLSIGLALLAGFIPVALNLGTEGWLALSGIAIVFAVFALLLLVTNLILGPTCECSILTAVHEERVVALGRLWQARKAIASLRPIIDTVQGTVTAEAAAETIAAIFATPEAQATIEQRMPTGQWAPAAQAPVAASRAARVLRRDSGNVHLALFIFLFLDAVIRLAGIVYPPLANYPLMLIMTLVLLCLIVAALVRQHRSDMSSPLRNTVWSLFVYACFLAVAIYIYEVMNQMEWQFGMQGQDVELARPRQILMMVVNTVASVCDLIFGSIGLVFLRSYLVSFRGVEAAKSES